MKKQYKPTRHTGILRPVIKDKIVIYRTTDENGRTSHIHHPIRSEYLNWGSNLTIGRIKDFMVVG